MLKLTDCLGHEIWLAYSGRPRRARGKRGNGFHEICAYQLRKGGQLIKSFWYCKFDEAGQDRAMRKLHGFLRAAQAKLINPEPSPCMALMCLR